jgi:hypothetical protein
LKLSLNEPARPARDRNGAVGALTLKRQMNAFEIGMSVSRQKYLELTS